MEIVRGHADWTQSHGPTRPVLTIGNFDGVHRGHQEILRLTVEKARAAGVRSVAYTFRPHPQMALRPDRKLELLSTYEERAEAIARAGIDFLIEEPFSREFSTTPADVFFREILIQKLSVSEIVVGYDFGFGKDRGGHLESLESYCRVAGVRLTVVPPQSVDDAGVASSSRIRGFLRANDLESANRLLGYSFSYRGVVLRGENRGHLLGFPTANIQVEAKLRLPLGVYATRTRLYGPVSPQLPTPIVAEFDSVTNLGIRPTFYASGHASGTHAQAEPAPVIETHLLDSAKQGDTELDLYGRTIEVRFIHYLREERKFDSRDALASQIRRDIDAAQALFARAKPSV